MRDKDYIAVAVGCNFSIVPSKELEEINLMSSGAVRFENETRNLYKAATYEESRKIDELLDRYGEYPIKDYIILDSKLDNRITDAQTRSGDINDELSELEQVWKVTFFHVTPKPKKHEFDVYVDMLPKELRDGKKEFLLDYDKQQEAFEKAKEVVGEDMLSEYVIMNAVLVDCARQSIPEKNIKESER